MSVFVLTVWTINIGVQYCFGLEVCIPAGVRDSWIAECVCVCVCVCVWVGVCVCVWGGVLMCELEVGK